jgi:hypothetical protein
MAPQAYQFNGKQLVKMETGLENLAGWWQQMTTADLDNDGDMDWVLGNVGENFYLHPDPENPVKLWVNDFDNNGIADKVLTRTVAGRDVPVFLKRDLTDQIPGLKKSNLQFTDFAKRSIDQLFEPDQLKKAKQSQFNFAKSIVAYNDGKGRFTVVPLPTMAQLSCITAIHTADVNGDNKTDLLIGGNRYDFLPQFSRLDASIGGLLRNTGQAFEWVPSTQSGLKVMGQVRDIVALQTPKGKQFVFLRNNDYPVLYTLRKNEKAAK